MTRKYYHLISKGDADDAGVPVVLDLLRYDEALPVDFSYAPVEVRTEYYLIATRAPELMTRRWQAHGIAVIASQLPNQDTALSMAKRRLKADAR